VDQVKSDENLSRYIIQSNQIRTSDKTVKYTAFMPAPNGKTSVFRTSGLQEEDIWEIGNNVAVQRQRNLYGRAEVAAGQVFDVGLHIEADDVPPRHANLTDWPDESSKQMAIALELEASAQLHLRN
jgi:hypothetical protein